MGYFYRGTYADEKSHSAICAKAYEHYNKGVNMLHGFKFC